MLIASPKLKILTLQVFWPKNLTTGKKLWWYSLFSGQAKVVRSGRNKKTYGSNQSCWASTFFLVADWLTALSLLSTKGLLSPHSSLYSNQHFSLSFHFDCSDTKNWLFSIFQEKFHSTSKGTFSPTSKNPHFSSASAPKTCFSSRLSVERKIKICHF